VDQQRRADEAGWRSKAVFAALRKVSAPIQCGPIGFMRGVARLKAFADPVDTRPCGALANSRDWALGHPMRRRAIIARIAWIFLALLLGVDLGAGRGFVLCVAPNEHVAVEDALASARCHAGQRAGSETLADASTALGGSPSSCRDTVLLEPSLQLRWSRDANLGFEQLAATATIALPLPGPLRLARTSEKHSRFMPFSPARLLRSVILLV